jgi:hypothetical protein
MSKLKTQAKKVLKRGRDFEIKEVGGDEETTLDKN